MESSLIKEFTRRDVQRLRNIINKNLGATTTTQVGYVAKTQEHKEGEVWMEENKYWTIKNGMKQTYSKLQSIRNELSTPLLCPKCKNKLRDKFDKKMYSLHGKCFSCVQAFETKLKLEGKYEEYVRAITKQNAKTILEDGRAYVEELAKTDTEYFLETGKKENWVGGDKDKILDRISEDLNKLEEDISGI